MGVYYAKIDRNDTCIYALVRICTFGIVFHSRTYALAFRKCKYIIRFVYKRYVFIFLFAFVLIRQARITTARPFGMQKKVGLND